MKTPTIVQAKKLYEVAAPGYGIHVHAEDINEIVADMRTVATDTLDEAIEVLEDWSGWGSPNGQKFKTARDCALAVRKAWKQMQTPPKPTKKAKRRMTRDDLLKVLCKIDNENIERLHLAYINDPKVTAAFNALEKWYA